MNLKRPESIHAKTVIHASSAAMNGAPSVLKRVDVKDAG